jgi:hypothetical protein
VVVPAAAGAAAAAAGQQQWWWRVRKIYIYKTLQKKLIFLSKNDVFEALLA